MVNKVLILSILWIVGSLGINGCTQREVEGIKRGKIVIRYAHRGHVKYNKFREDEAKKFEKLYPNIIVRYEPIEGRDYWTKIMTMIAGGTVADVFSNDDVITLAKKRAILDLTPYMEKDKEYFDEIYPQLIEFNRYKGKIYGLPSNLNINVLFYNKKLFDENGLSYPDETLTWETMLEAARKLTKRNNRGVTTQFGWLPYATWTYFRQNGGSIWNEDNTECVINSPENVEVLHFFKDITNKHHVSPTITEAREQGSWDMFIDGRLGMVCGGRWLTALFKLRKDLSWGITLLPKIKNRDSWASFNNLSVSSTTKHPEFAYELAKFLTRPEAIKFLVGIGDSIPIRWSSEENEYLLHEPGRPEKENQVYLDAMNHAYTEKWVYHPGIPYEIQRAIISQETETFLLTEEISAEETLQNIQKRLNALLKESKQE